MEFESLHANFSFVDDHLIDKIVSKLELFPRTNDIFDTKIRSDRIQLNQFICSVIFEVKLDRDEATWFWLASFLINHVSLFAAGTQAKEMSVLVG